jgi:hypothetical protein
MLLFLNAWMSVNPLFYTLLLISNGTSSILAVEGWDSFHNIQGSKPWEGPSPAWCREAVLEFAVSSGAGSPKLRLCGVEWKDYLVIIQFGGNKDSRFRWCMSWDKQPQNVRTKSHSLGGLTNRNVFLHNSGGWRSKVKTDLVLSVAFWWSTSPYLFTWAAHCGCLP